MVLPSTVMFVVFSPESISILWPEVNFHFEYNV
jgi:hypothetical protein